MWPENLKHLEKWCAHPCPGPAFLHVEAFDRYIKTLELLAFSRQSPVFSKFCFALGASHRRLGMANVNRAFLPFLKGQRLHGAKVGCVCVCLFYFFGLGFIILIYFLIFHFEKILNF